MSSEPSSTSPSTATSLRHVVGDIALSALVAVVVFGSIQWWQGRDSSGHLAKGSSPPAFALVDSQTGQSVSLDSLKGRPVVLNFWATWCQPCRAEMPALERLHRSSGKQLHMVTVTADDPVLVKRFLRNGNHTLPCLMDTSGAVSESYQVTSLPRTVVLDSEGKVAWDVVGQVDLSALRDTLGALGL